MDERRKLQIGAVLIEWRPAAYPSPIAVDLENEARFITLCEITYKYGNGKHGISIPAGYSFDGISTPWLVRWIPGFWRFAWHFLATLPHDYVCDHPEELPRPVGDGIFISILLAIAGQHFAGLSPRERRRRRRQAWVMYAAVVIWSTIQTIGAGPLKIETVEAPA